MTHPETDRRKPLARADRYGRSRPCRAFRARGARRPRCPSPASTPDGEHHRAHDRIGCGVHDVCDSDLRGHDARPLRSAAGRSSGAGAAAVHRQSRSTPRWRCFAAGMPPPLRSTRWGFARASSSPGAASRVSCSPALPLSPTADSQTIVLRARKNGEFAVSRPDRARVGRCARGRHHPARRRAIRSDERSARGAAGDHVHRAARCGDRVVRLIARARAPSARRRSDRDPRSRQRSRAGSGTPRTSWRRT